MIERFTAHRGAMRAAPSTPCSPLDLVCDRMAAVYLVRTPDKLSALGLARPVA